jgi:hypothetical protein
MADDEVVFNGINASNGGYLHAKSTTDAVASLARGKPAEPDPVHAKALVAWNELKSNEDGTRDVEEGIKRVKLEQTGWSVLFPFAADDNAKAAQQAILDALRPLLDLRKAQASKVEERYYREFLDEFAFRPGDSKSSWLARFGAAPGSPANPENVPYYVLIVADAETIPLRFQYQLDVEYAVGRIHFDTVEEYAAYARSVVSAERKEVKRPRRVTFFGVRNDDDRPTQQSYESLIKPLAKKLDAFGWDGWTFPTVDPELAKKARLAELLGGPDTPALLFTASHGVGFDKDDPRQFADQGALLCQDWPGPAVWPKRQSIPNDYYFGADDVAADADLHGLIAFHFACYGAGTPKLDDYPDLRLGTPPAQLASRSFLARMPAKLLSHPKGGALAVIGHIDRAWACSFTSPKAGPQTGTFFGVLARLLNGEPVGAATETLNQRYAALASELGTTLQEDRTGTTANATTLAGLWTANNDARSYVVIGDPAVRLCVADAPAEPSNFR